jgi:hypothetical protein
MIEADSLIDTNKSHMLIFRFNWPHNERADLIRESVDGLTAE